jgi:hypothetical protein
MARWGSFPSCYPYDSGLPYSEEAERSTFASRRPCPKSVPWGRQGILSSSPGLVETDQIREITQALKNVHLGIPFHILVSILETAVLGFARSATGVQSAGGGTETNKYLIECLISTYTPFLCRIYTFHPIYMEMMLGYT